MGQIRSLIFVILSQTVLLLSANPVQSDSIPDIELKEVEVEAQMQRTDAQQATYIPTSQQKKSAIDAAQLLGSMGIPQITVSPEGSIKSVSNQSVSLFINKIPASEGDLSGLNMADVKKVEVLEYPTDFHYRNAPLVVNIVTVKYEWGGYTKLIGKLSPIVNRNIAGQVFSRFAYKRMTYDLNFTKAHNSINHAGAVTTRTFRLTDYMNSGPHTVSYTRDDRETSIRNDVENLKFRATYESKNLQIINILTSRWSRTPEYLRTVNISSDSPIPDTGIGVDNMGSRSYDLAWMADAYLSLPKDYQIIVGASLLYNHSNKRRDYQIDGNPVIFNPTREDAWSGGVSLAAQKRFLKKNILLGAVSFDKDANNVDYPAYGDRRMRYRHTYPAAMISYKFNTRRWNIDVTAAWSWLSTKVDDGKYSTVSKPQLSSNIAFSPNSHHRLSMTLRYRPVSAEAYQEKSVMTQSDQLMWTVGNPNLHPADNAYASLFYLWLLSNRFQLSCSGSYNDTWNQHREVYTPDGLTEPCCRHGLIPGMPGCFPSA